MLENRVQAIQSYSLKEVMVSEREWRCLLKRLLMAAALKSVCRVSKLVESAVLCSARYSPDSVRVCVTDYTTVTVRGCTPIID